MRLALAEGMVLVVAGLLALLSVVSVVYPFLRRGAPEEGHEERAEAGQHDAELGSVLDAIHTLDLERELGHVTEEVYEEQMQGYRVEAEELLKRGNGAGPATSEESSEEAADPDRTAAR